MNSFNLYIPNCFYINVLMNTFNSFCGYYIYLYSNNYYFIFHVFQNSNILKKNNLFLNKNTNIIIFYSYFKLINFKTLSSSFYNFLFSLEYIYFKKIKFTGKGFKIRKKNNNIILFFNTAHINLFLIQNLIVFRLNKAKYIILKNNKFHINKDSLLFKSVKQNNIFTKRGIRLCRQLIYKKKGKN